MKHEIIIRKAAVSDHDQIWKIISMVISTGDTYVFSPDSSKEKMLAYWCGEDKHAYVALLNDEIAGTFFLKDNFPDLGSHVANASYMTMPGLSGKGIGRAMAAYSLVEAKRLGYKSIQFNIVVETNVNAIALWEKLDFQIIGKIPRAFNHAQKGLIAAYIMWREL